MSVDFIKNICQHYDAGYQCLVIPTSDEKRCEDDLALAAKELQCGITFWDEISGFRPGENKAINPVAAIASVVKADFYSKPNCMVVMRDMHSHFGKSDVRRAIRSLSAAYMFSHKEQRRPLISCG